VNPFPTPQEAAQLLAREAAQQEAAQLARLSAYAHEARAMGQALAGSTVPDYRPPVEIADLPIALSDATVAALTFRHLGYLPAAGNVDEVAALAETILQSPERVLAALATLGADPKMRNRISDCRRDGRLSQLLLCGLILSLP
jgi:hypothetical protein